MKIAALAEYTKQKQHSGQNSMQILEKFIEYARNCNDPENIFAYMQEKSICVYLAHYWVAKAEYLAGIGDFRAAFECLREGQSRSDIITQDEIDFSVTKQCFFKRLIAIMKQFPVRGKRTAQEYELLSGDHQASSNNIEKVLQIYEGNYLALKEQLENNWNKKRQEGTAVQSWMFKRYQQQDQKIRKIEEMMPNRTSNCSLMDISRHKSMTTPMKNRRMRKLNKTIDSVELLKKKKRTSEDLSKSRRGRDDSSDDQSQQEGTSSRKYQSVPICRIHSTSRRVTFKNLPDLEKIRSESRHKILNRSSSLINRSSSLINRSRSRANKGQREEDKKDQRK